jgi:hypothetical protein
MTLIAGLTMCSSFSLIPRYKGAKTAGVNGRSTHYLQAVVGVEQFGDRLRSTLKDRNFTPAPGGSG